MKKYKLEKLPENKCEKFKVVITADANDADYKTTVVEYDRVEFETHIIKDLKILKTKYMGSHKTNDLEEDDEILDNDWLEIPEDEYGEYCHTIKSIDVTYIDKSGTQYNVIF